MSKLSEQFRLHPSAAGKIGGKKIKLGETGKTYLREWYIFETYGFKKDITSKYLDKGIELEEEAIVAIAELYDLPFAAKNEVTKRDDFFEGACDLDLPEMIRDTKCSWDFHTFPAFATECPSFDYEVQVQIYMHLYGKKRAAVDYYLGNTPIHLAVTEADLFDYSAIPLNRRVKSFYFYYDEAIIERLKALVLECRDYINELEKQY